MLGEHEQGSAVARLLAQIGAEYEAAQRGLSGLSYGAAQHTFINERTNNIGQLHTELRSLVGDDAATRLVCEKLDQMP